MKVRFMMLSLAFMLAFAGGANTALAEDVIRVSVEAPYAPFAYYDENKQLVGFDVEIAKALCEQMNRKCEILDVPFEKMIPEILEGKIDIAVAGMGNTEERAKLVDFTDRYYRSHSLFVEKTGSVKGIDTETLKGKRIGVQRETIQEKHLLANYKESTVVPYLTIDDIFEALASNKIDVGLVDGLPGYNYLKTDKGAAFETVGGPVYSNIIQGDSCIAVSKKLPELTKALNKAIDDIRRNGVYSKVNRKYFDFNVY